MLADLADDEARQDVGHAARCVGDDHARPKTLELRVEGEHGAHVFGVALALEHDGRRSDARRSGGRVVKLFQRARVTPSGIAVGVIATLEFVGMMSYGGLVWSVCTSGVIAPSMYWNARSGLAAPFTMCRLVRQATGRTARPERCGQEAAHLLDEAHRFPAARVSAPRLLVPALLGQPRQVLLDVIP